MSNQHKVCFNLSKLNEKRKKMSKCKKELKNLLFHIAMFTYRTIFWKF